MTKTRYEYKAVRTPDLIDQLQPILNEYAKEGWRLVQTFISSGYTVGMIFEKENDHPCL